MAITAAIAAVALISLYFAFAGRTAELIVTVAGPGGRALDAVEIFVDGEKECDVSPCRLSELAPGPHLIRVDGRGYQPTADQAVSLEAGEEATHHITLAPRSGGTGIHVSAKGSGLKLFVDGEEIGALPQTLKDLEPGNHVIQVGGNPRYEPWEQTIEVVANKLQTVGPVEPKVLKGLATIKAGPGADGAQVLLGGRVIPKLPATIEVPADKEHTLVAKRDGYGTYRRIIRFDDGSAEKTFEITMVETDSAPVETAAASPRSPRKTSPRPQLKLEQTSKPAPATGNATINMNSIPASNVILNGRPLGATPKLGVQVAAGPQTVVFVHPEHGRKIQSATVGPGASKTFMVRFP